MADGSYLPLVIVSALALALCAQPAPDDAAVRVGPGVTAPKLRKHTEPSYTRDALNAGVQGTVVLELVVDENGEPKNIRVLSPLGFGLDERAEAAIAQWKFVPGTKDGKPAKVMMTAEVNFWMLGKSFDVNAEHRRTQFNVALRTLKTLNGKPSPQLLKTIQDLARQKSPGAMYLLGKWFDLGEGVPKDPERGLELIKNAADQHYGPALYEMGRNYLDGTGFPANREKGLEMIRNAAVLGSVDAQYFLGFNYDNGQILEHDESRARQYYRLCGAKGVPACQHNLGRLLFNSPDRKEHQYIEALAWFQLAAEQGLPQAKALVDGQMPKLTSEQAGWVRKLKSQLVPGTLN